MSRVKVLPRASAVVAGAAALALALTSCGSSSSGDADPSATASETSAPSVLTAAAECGPGEDSSNTFALGTFLPLTGSRSPLGPAAVAGVGLALSEINAAGGVYDRPACVVATDSSDETHDADVTQPSIDRLIQAKVSAIIGAESASVILNVLQSKVDPVGIIMFSPSIPPENVVNTSPWFFSAAVPASVEGSALGRRILAGGHAKVAVLTSTGEYATGLRDAVAAAIVAGGGEVVYGAEGAGQEFDPAETAFDAAAQAVVATGADAVVVDALPDQTPAILAALAAAGWSMTGTYLVDSNTQDYSAVAGVPDLTGAQGVVLQGRVPSEEFTQRLADWYDANEGSSADVHDWSYAAESYDATVIVALAALLAGSNAPADIQPFILPVSGASGGTECSGYAECRDLIAGGTTDIHYVGVSGIGPLSDLHEPSTGYVTIYGAVGKNALADVIDAVEG